MMVSAAFSRFPRVSMNVVACVGPSSTGLSSCGSARMLLFRIPDKLICVTLSLIGSTSMLSLNSCISDLDGYEVILWLDSCGVDKTIGCWLLDEPSYKKSLLSRLGRGSVGVDVLCIGGGVFFRFCKTVWVRCLDLEDCLVIGGVVLVVLCLE